MTNLANFRYVDLLGSAGFEPRNALYDVEFVVLDTEDKSIGSMKAHKLLLSFVSPVLKRQFFNDQGGKRCEEICERVEIRGFSFESFDAFAKYLYSGNYSLIEEMDNLGILLQLYLLFSKYQIRGSCKIIREKVSEFDLVKEKFQEVFEVLVKYRDDFILEEVVDILWSRCVMVVQKEVKTEEDFQKFWEETFSGKEEDDAKEDLEVKDFLRKKILYNGCLNCTERKCKDGAQITQGREGMRIRATAQIVSLNGLVTAAAGWLGTVDEYKSPVQQKYCTQRGVNYNTQVSVRWDGYPQYLAFIATAANIVYNCNEKKK